MNKHFVDEFIECVHTVMQEVCDVIDEIAQRIEDFMGEEDAKLSIIKYVMDIDRYCDLPPRFTVTINVEDPK